ncbi:hypothetical protein [Candidatus Ichthyocystis sparus]|uniref:hypothetical protein n=2 Tax=Candidatus Ichthyocystis sparus TaxID=1561004 RepID=UPI000B826018|nr:hypothetical protein [Candidatus Ichthyocystis sparus]
MYPAATTSAAAFSDVPDSGGEGGVVQVGISGSDLQQIDVSAPASDVAAVRKGVGARGSAASALIAASSAFLGSLGIRLHPDSARVVDVFFFEFDLIAKGILDTVMSKQFPSSTSDKLTVTGRTIWYGTYRALCEVDFVHRCLRKYHANLRPAFIRLLPEIKVLSDSGSGLETLAGVMLMSFLSKLDSTIRGIMDGIFSCHWDKAVGKVFGALEQGALDGVSCKDFICVLHIAGAPSVASSSLSRLRTQSSRIRKSSKGVNRCAASGEGPSSVSITEERPTSSSGVSVPTSAHAGTGIICTTVGEAGHVQCVDLLGVKLHPGSAGMVYKLFSDFRESAKRSYSNSILNYLLMIVDGELPLVERAIWCSTYRELHLYSFMSKCLSIYYYKCRPDFINSLPSIRVLSNSSSSGCELVPLSGGSLSGFLSKLDCAIRDDVSSMFNLEWGREVARVSSKLEDGLLSDVSCRDFVNVLNVAGIPVVALSYYQLRTLGKRKMPENSDKVTGEGTTSEDGTTGTVSPYPNLQLQHELSSQPEPLLPEPESLPEPASNVSDSEEVLGHGTVGGGEISENSDKVTGEGTTSEDGTTGTVSSSSSSQLKFELSPQPEPESLPGGVGSLIPLVVDSVASSNVSGESLTASDVLLLSTAGDAVSDSGVLGYELPPVPSFSPGLIPESLSPSFELDQMPVFPPLPYHHWLEKLD